MSRTYTILRGLTAVMLIAATAIVAFTFLSPADGKWGGLVVLVHLMASAALCLLAGLGSLVLWLMRRHKRQHTTPHSADGDAT